MKKFESNVLSKQDKLQKINPANNKQSKNTGVIDEILNDTRAWKNDGKELFNNTKRKSEARWTKPTIQGVILEVEGRNNSNACRISNFDFSYKITNPKMMNDSYKRSASRSLEQS